MKKLLIVLLAVGSLTAFANIQSKIICERTNIRFISSGEAVNKAPRLINKKIEEAHEEGFTVVSAPTSVSRTDGETEALCVTVTKP